MLYFAMLTGDKCNVSWVLYSMASIKMQVGEHWDAIELLDKVFEFFRNIYNSSLLSYFYFLKEQAYINLLMFNESVYQIRVVSSLLKDWESPGAAGYGYIIFGGLFDSIGERDSSKAAYDLSLNHTKKAGEAQGAANCLFRLSEMALRETDILTSLKYPDQG